jgi:cytochrome c-type protein NapC
VPSLIGSTALVSGVLAIAILAHYLLARPPLDLRNKLWLLLGLGLLPAITAGASTAQGLQDSTERKFCGSCHVMQAHVDDANDMQSTSLASRHGRNPNFGDRNCYVCHANYGMFGYALTKVNGMRHVWEYYVGGYAELSLEEALTKIHLYKPYSNQNCMQCHSGTLESWQRVPEHMPLLTDLQQNRVSCASGGCHGYAHPFSKPAAAAELAPTLELGEGVAP